MKNFAVFIALSFMIFFVGCTEPQRNLPVAKQTTSSVVVHTYKTQDNDGSDLYWYMYSTNNGATTSYASSSVYTTTPLRIGVSFTSSPTQSLPAAVRYVSVRGQQEPEQKEELVEETSEDTTTESTTESSGESSGEASGGDSGGGGGGD
jgi:uncharacterized membrane protein YgcG